MDINDAVLAMSALAQDTRLKAFRLLVVHEPEGIAAGKLAGFLAVPQNTLSAHLAILERAGFISGKRQGRSILYRADLSRLRELTIFLVKDCCQGRPEICAPLLSDFASCCAGQDLPVNQEVFP
jgi:ArsR family transcriptional regulator, arsenate/arsenite/antimonite-responsive transcriptional repressor